ncbi:MAG TPA: hypothetical protein VFN52_06640, partial [Acidiferrobacteraceae bacterium]|nr:hypothetical protein [Acidiferrobacteraceae bacterium]
MAPAIAYGLVSNVAPASLSWSSTRLLGAALGAGWAMIEPPPVWYHEPGDADGDPDLNPDEWHLS